jgi:hypothetical protein
MGPRESKTLGCLELFVLCHLQRRHEDMDDGAPLGLELGSEEGSSDGLVGSEEGLEDGRKDGIAEGFDGGPLLGLELDF